MLTKGWRLRVCGMFRHADFVKCKFKNERKFVDSEIVLHE